MGKKRTTTPKDERQDKAAKIAAELPDDSAALLDCAAEAVRQFDAAVMACNDDAADAALDRYDAVVWKLNGGTFSSCKAHDDAPAYVVQRHCAAEPGTVPIWGQHGEFLITVQGIRAVVEIGDGFGRKFAHYRFHVVDVDSPFISETGFLSHFAPVMGGVTVKEAAERYMAAFLKERGRVLISPDSRRFCKAREPRPWLAELTAPQIAPQVYQLDNGQMAFAF